MKHLKYLLTGILFGIVMSKAEIISWYRIYEMFRFDSFHMYGIIGSAVVLGVISLQIIKRSGATNILGDKITFVPKHKSVIRYLLGGTIFGLGWAMVGACPGPLFVLVGQGYYAVLVIIVGALAGTMVYGMLRHKLPH